ncbi:MAG: hypothetical protein Q8Q85_14660 [Gemmatimonadales bacterium]|nr:hypothetical protein [Gemmatimonadales bacterium]
MLAITELDVTLTDYAVAVECAVFTFLLRDRDPRDHRPLRAWCALFFASVGAAALIGGTVHGFFVDPRTRGYAILWPAALVSIGVTAWATWMIGAGIRFSAGVARRIGAAAAAQFAGYCVVVLFVTQAFGAAIANYLPAAVFLLVVLALHYRRARERPVLMALAGLGLTFIAAGVQQGGIALHPVYFNHNALYHLIQAAALLMLFLGLRWIVARRAVE